MYSLLEAINGAVSAASLAARSLRLPLSTVAISPASQFSSSNLAIGSIKYMENFEFLLVNKLCQSRNTLAAAYPSTVQEIRFLPLRNKGFRFPAFLVFLGSMLYWIIGRFSTKLPKYMTRERIKALEQRIDITRADAGLEYSDCYLYDNDARSYLTLYAAPHELRAIAQIMWV